MPTDKAERRSFPRVDEPSFDTPTHEQAAEQRAHRRYEYRVAVGILGSWPQSGTTLNISRGGVKVGFAEPVPGPRKGQWCAVRFLDAGDELRPHYMVGTVRRVEVTEEGCLVAIKFDAPLELLKVPHRPSP